jgi:alanine-synthesizing transaminase
LDEENDWNPDIDDIRKKITDKTQAILISSPNNPTGSMASIKVVKEIIDLAGENNLIVVSDEIYDKIIFEGEYKCPASMTKDVPIIGMNGFSKAHMATGWRLGYLYFHNFSEEYQDLKKNIEKLARIRLCANTPAQYAAVESYKNPRDHTERMVENLQRRRDYAYKRLTEIPEISVVKPKGTFYMFPKIDLGTTWKDDKEFVLEMLRETGVCTVYGSGFGMYGDGHFRMTFLPSKAELEQVFDKIEDWANIKRKN